MTIFVERDATTLLCSSQHHAAFHRRQQALTKPTNSSTTLDHQAEAYSSKVTVDDDLPLQLNNRFRFLPSGFMAKGGSGSLSDDEHLGTTMVFDQLPDLDETDDDCTTVSSCSSGTSRSSRSSSSSSTVRFSYPLVTEVRSRPRTRAKDVRKLFYSNEEIQRFRAIFRQERKHEDEDTIPSESTEENKSNLDEDSRESSKETTPTDYRISRVEILHKDKLQTYVDECISDSNSLLGTVPNSGDVKTAEGDFFDNESFWTGKITWY